MKPLTVKEYYTAPPDHVFEDIEANAKKIWESYSHPDYVREQLVRIVI